MSAALRSSGLIDSDVLDRYDGGMREVLSATKRRSRRTLYVQKLRPLSDQFTDAISVPIIRHEGSPRPVAARTLREDLAKYLSEDEKSYVEEAALCVTVGCNRAAIIMLWAAAVSRLHRAIENVGFSTFNSAIQSAPKAGQPYNRIRNRSRVSSLPELQRTPDSDILIIGMDLWKYDLQAYKELERLLGIRNDAAHPGMANPSLLDVQQFASKVGQFVFQQITI